MLCAHTDLNNKRTYDVRLPIITELQVCGSALIQISNVARRLSKNARRYAQCLHSIHIVFILLSV
jgi:hypothetical protein